MGLFSRTVLICPHCVKGFPEIGGGAKCPECGGEYLTPALNETTWNTWSVEEQKNYCAQSICVEEENFISTMDIIPNKEIAEYKGLVHGAECYLFGGIIGEGISKLDKYFGNAYKKACSSMYYKALEKGADAVVGVKTETSVVAQQLIVIVTGTAVKLKEDS